MGVVYHGQFSRCDDPNLHGAQVIILFLFFAPWQNLTPWDPVRSGDRNRMKSATFAYWIRFWQEVTSDLWAVGAPHKETTKVNQLELERVETIVFTAFRLAFTLHVGLGDEVCTWAGRPDHTESIELKRDDVSTLLESRVQREAIFVFLGITCWNESGLNTRLKVPSHLPLLAQQCPFGRRVRCLQGTSKMTDAAYIDPMTQSLWIVLPAEKVQ